jgi:alpha-1,2-mannosyltransferase
LKIGIFHPRLNICGGGEWVALSIINSLRENGHKVIVLTDEPIDQAKYKRTFGQELKVDGEVVFPFHFFRRGDAHNIYADMISCFILKSKCDLIIDTFTCLILPSVDIVYMHYPLFKQSAQPTSTLARLKIAIYFLPYRAYEMQTRKRTKQIVLANSKFTSNAVKNSLGLNSIILYPPVSSFFLQNEKPVSDYKRLNQVVTVSRFAPEKNLDLIPHIAKRIDDTKFLIIGNMHHKKVYSQLQNLIRELDVEERVVLMTNVSKPLLKQILLESKIYLHCAVNEHFGISLIEAMACGCLPIANDSGGPKESVPKNLRYVSIDEAVSKIIQNIREWSPQKAQEMHDNALKFSQENFSKQLISLISAIDC